MKSALFVDFDNVYSGLRKLDPASADQFARQPMRWLQWLLEELPAPEHAPANAQRRLLVRRSYLNPQAYQRYRPGFQHAGFEIVDCPAMTSEGKTSTDIHMVLDMVELLQHEVHYDEFILFSADADFTPVLRKLRKWDRRTTVLAIGFPAAAYRASADLLIDPAEFVREALGMGGPELAWAAASPVPALPVAATCPGADRLAGLEPALRALILQVHQCTGVPTLPPAAFRALLEAVATEAREGSLLPDAAGLGVGLRVAEALRASGWEVAPDEVDWVLRNLVLAGHDFHQGQDDLRALSYKLAGHLVNLCRREQMPAEDGLAGTLHRWVSGKLGERPGPGDMAGTGR